MEPNKFRKRLHEPWFTLVIKKIKTITSLPLDEFKDIKENDIITFYNDNPGFNGLREIDVKVVYTAKCKSAADYLYFFGLSKTLPGVVTIPDGIKILSKQHSVYPIKVVQFSLITRFIRSVNILEN